MEDIDLVVRLTGIVSRLEGIDICMDGAKYNLHSDDKLIRLKAITEEADHFLSKVAGSGDKPSRFRVMVLGRYQEGVEGPSCDRFDAYFAGEPEIEVTFRNLVEDKEKGEIEEHHMRAQTSVARYGCPGLPDKPIIKDEPTLTITQAKISVSFQNQGHASITSIILKHQGGGPSYILRAGPTQVEPGTYQHQIGDSVLACDVPGIAKSTIYYS